MMTEEVKIEKENVKQIVTNKFIDYLQSRNIDGKYEQPWFDLKYNEKNATTDKPYNGMNAILLGLNIEFNDNRWMTFKQAGDNEYFVKKGEKGHKIIKYDVFEKSELNENNVVEIKKIPFLKSFTVFNAEQVGKYVNNEETQEKEWKSYADLNPYERVEYNLNNIENLSVILKELAKNNITVIIDDNITSPVEMGVFDTEIRMPNFDKFKGEEYFVSTLVNQLIKASYFKYESESTDKKTKIDTALENMSTEIASAIITAQFGIKQTEEHIKNHAIYVKKWINCLKNDPNAIFNVVKKANQIVEYFDSMVLKKELLEILFEKKEYAPKKKMKL